MSGHRPQISVVLLNFRSSRDLPACLGGLLNQTFKDFEILLVDQGQKDGSSDTALRVFSDHFGTRLRLLRAGRNLGFGGGCNLALSHARGRWVALLDTDAVPDPPWLEALVTAAEGDETVAMCASRIRLLANPEFLENAGHGLYSDGLLVPRGRGSRDGPRWETPDEVLCPSGAAALYSRHALRSIGGFPDSFFSYGEDLDVGLSLRAKGHRCLYVPKATVRHHLAGTWGRRSLRKAYLTERNRAWIAIRHFPAPALASLPAFTLVRWAMVVKAGLKGSGPLAQLIADSKGNVSLDDPPLGRLRGRGAQLGAVTRLLSLGGAVTIAQLSAAAGARKQLQARRELHEIGAMGASHYRDWLNLFGATATDAARGWLDGSLVDDNQLAPPT